MSVMPPCNHRMVAGCGAEDDPPDPVVRNWTPCCRLWPTVAGLSVPSVLRTSRPSPVLTTTARAAGPADPVWSWGTVVLVGGTVVVLGTDVDGLGTVVVWGVLVVLVVAGGPVVVVRGSVVVVVGEVVVVDDVVVVVGGGSAIAASRPTPLAMASEPRPPPRTSATASPRARGRSLGPTRRTDMGYPLVRSTECLPGTARPQPDGPRSSTLLARALLRAA